MSPIIISLEHISGDKVRTPSVFLRLRNGYALTITPVAVRIHYAGELSERSLAVKIDALNLPFEVNVSLGEWRTGTGYATRALAKGIRLKPVEIALPPDIYVPANAWNYPILGQLTENVSWTHREVEPARLSLIGSVQLTISDTLLILSRTDGFYHAHTFPAL